EALLLFTFLRSFHETRPTTACPVGKMAVVTRYSRFHGNEGKRTRFIGSVRASIPPVHKIGWCGEYRANSQKKTGTSTSTETARFAAFFRTLAGTVRNSPRLTQRRSRLHQFRVAR